MNFINKVFKRNVTIPNAKDLSSLNLDDETTVDKSVKRVIRNLANAIIESNRHFKKQHNVKVIFDCSYDESNWVGGSNYYIPIKMHLNEVDFEAKLIVELTDKGYSISNREYKEDTRVLYFSINW
jgi:hypothetical protein